MFRLYFFLPVLAVTSQNYWKCDPKDTVIPQLNSTFSFPDSGETLPYSKNMNCTWTINIPKSYVVIVDITANFAASDRFSIISSTGCRHDFNGDTNDIPQLFTGPLYFPEGELEIVLISGNSNSDGYLSFTLQQQKSYIDTHSNYGLGHITDSQDFIQSMTPLYPSSVYGFTSDREYVIRLVTYLDSIYYSSCFVYAYKYFQNNDNEISFLTGLATQIEGVPKRFTGAILITCFSETIASANVVVASLPSSIHPQSEWTVKPAGKFNYTLTSNNGYPSYFTTTTKTQPTISYANDILVTAKGGNNNQNTKFELYCGSLAPVVAGEYRSMQFLEEIPLEESDNYLPQRLCMDWNTYAVTNGSVRLGINNLESYNEDLLEPPHKGFVVTDYFGFQKSSTSARFTIYGTASQILQFSYTMGNQNMPMDSVWVYVRNNDQSTNDTLSGSVYTGQTYLANGTSMEIRTIPPSHQSSYGAQIFFEVVDAFDQNSISQRCLLIVLWLSYAFSM